MKTKVNPNTSLGTDIEMKQKNVGYPGEPHVEGSGSKLIVNYIVGKKPEVKHIPVHTHSTYRDDRKLSG